MPDRHTSEDAGEMGDVRRKTDGVRAAPSRTELYEGTYTRRWKNLCRELLRAYVVQSPEAINGKPLGATALRKQISEKLGNKSIGITIDNIYDFLYKNIYLDDVKFSFLDQFIRHLQIDDPSFNVAKQKIRDEIDERVRSALSGFFSFRRNDDNVPEAYLDVFLERTFVSQPMADENLRMPRSGIGNNLNFCQVAVRFDNFKNGMFAATAIYSLNSFWKLKKSKIIPRGSVGIYHGYLIPQYVGEMSQDVIYGTIHLRKEGVEGIGAVYPSTVSSFSYHDDLGSRLVTDWVPQILLPLRQSTDTAATGLYPDSTQVKLEKNDRYDTQSYLDKGVMTMTPLPNEFSFVENFIKGLTNEYSIW